MSSESTNSFSEEALSSLRDCSRLLIFDDSLHVLHATYPVQQGELQPLTNLFGDREQAMRNGMVIEGKRFEVHRHHPPLVYGRSMTEEPEHSEGAAICRVEKGPQGKPVYAAITYLACRAAPIGAHCPAETAKCVSQDGGAFEVFL